MSRYPHIPSRPEQRPLLAPGTVEGYRVGWLGTPAQRRELWRFLGLLTAIGGAAIGAALLLGLLLGWLGGR